jgi:hypothetical protein
MKEEVSQLLKEKRFRRRLKSKVKRKRKRIAKQKSFEASKGIRLAGKTIISYNDALLHFMPLHFLHLITKNNSPFHQDKLPKKERTLKETIVIPKRFSIVENPGPSYRVLKDLVASLLYQHCDELLLDYKDCEYCDLVTQVFMDSILKSHDRFVKLCKVAKLTKYIGISGIGAQNINNPSLQLMINSVGSPVELLNRKMQFPNVIPFRLRHLEAKEVTQEKIEGQKEIDATELIEYVEKCLVRFHKTLTQDAKRDLGYVIGETIANAEEHSTLHNRYLIGYMEESNESDSHYGLLNVVIMNTGNTIYERFKYPEQNEIINMECVKQMQELSDKFVKKGFFSLNRFTEENLWTLYSLQGGVSIVPKEVRNRGNGTIGFIQSFFNLKGSLSVDNVSRMTIISGNTQIDFDGTYQISKTYRSDGTRVERMTFNDSNSLEDKPNSKYVHHIDNYFPGTLISAKLLINDDDVQ